MDANRDDASDVPEMFRDLVSAQGPLTLLAADRERAALAMLLAWKTAERQTDPALNEREELVPDSHREACQITKWQPQNWRARHPWTLRRSWLYGLSLRSGTEVESRDVIAWERGTEPVPTTVLAAALELAGLDVDDIYFAPDSLAEWIDLVVRVSEQMRPSTYIQKAILPRMMTLPGRAAGKSWKGFAADLGKASNNLRKIENLMRATLAEAERLRYLALAGEEDEG